MWWRESGSTFFVLALHAISGLSEQGVHVRENVQREVDFFAENNVFTGALKESYDRLAKKLCGEAR